jgi:hypothetical protein
MSALATHSRELQVVRLEQTYVGDQGVRVLVKGCR